MVKKERHSAYRIVFQALFYALFTILFAIGAYYKENQVQEKKCLTRNLIIYFLAPLKLIYFFLLGYSYNGGKKYKYLEVMQILTLTYFLLLAKLPIL